MIPEGKCQCGCGGDTVLNKINDRHNGYVKGEYRKFRPGHNHRKPFSVTTTEEYQEEDRGFATPCWVWQHRLTHAGYGQKRMNGRSPAAHRVYYERAKGPIPEGLELDHLCCVKACVNPDHLEPVTGNENKRRAGRFILTEDDVREIRRIGRKQRLWELAAQFGVGQSAISAILNGKTWKDITP